MSYAFEILNDFTEMRWLTNINHKINISDLGYTNF